MVSDRPDVYDFDECDEMTLAVLAELAEVRERLAALPGYLDPYNDLRSVAVGRADVLAALDAMAAEIVANNTDQDDEEPELVLEPARPVRRDRSALPLCSCPPRDCHGARLDAAEVRCAAVCQILPGL